MNFSAVCLFVVSLGMACPTMAKVLDCAMATTQASGGWVTDRYIFDIDDAAGSVQAIDGLIQSVHGGPMVARLADNSAKKTVVTWTVQMTSSSGQQTKMQYRAAIFNGDKTITVTATPGGGYSNRFEARGKCK
jgi:hypothetical protein